MNYCITYFINISIHKFLKHNYRNYILTYPQILFNYSKNTNVCLSTSCEQDQKKSKKPTKYKHTILFPSSTFPVNPVKKQRIENEKKIKNLANFAATYDLQEERDAVEYILHDGPPYANGRLHMGHALNKILKDAIVRHKYMKGHKVSFIPGWDCHGLPIELEALKKARQRKEKNVNIENNSNSTENFTPLEIRSKARALAETAIDMQKKSFDQWGLFVNWDKHYRTDDPTYTARELQVFRFLYEKNFVYQAYMPVHFSPSSRTSLAESELEYNEEHESPSLYLALPLTQGDYKVLGAVDSNSYPVYLPIWTTTPWTLPSNMAICVNELSDYVLLRVKIEGREVRLVCMSDRLEEVVAVIRTPAEVLKHFTGSALKGMTYAHPLSGRPCPVILSEHVSKTKGTGLVHTAPAHGKDDFHVALQNGIPTDVQLVDDEGRMKAEAGNLLVGKRVPEEANEAVISILKSHRGECHSPLVLNLSTVVHSYPYDWRTKKPTIMRASKQWFFDLTRVKEQAVKALENVRLYPEKERIHLVNRIRSRPYWCISRQRSWGVPLPVFYEPDTGEPVVTGELIDHLASLFLREGADAWWRLSEEELLPQAFVQARKEAGQNLPVKGTDILDIWFDSGCSWYCALGGQTSDLYIEGKDQMNGWFQSSLLTSVAITGQAPYRTVFMHGFTVDEKNRKMSKSLRNVFDPDLIVNGGKNFTTSPAYGVSVLRWWAFRSTPTQNVKFGMELMRICDSEVKAIRASFAFYLGALHRFQSSQLVEVDQLRIEDQYVLSRIQPYFEKVWNHFENFELEKLPDLMYDFLVTEMGNEYMNSAKDILFFEREDDPRRRSILTTVFLFLPFLSQSLWPILPHVAEEVAFYYREIQEKMSRGSSSTSTYTLLGEVVPPTEWTQFQNVWKFEEVLAVKKALVDALSALEIPGQDSINMKLHLKTSKKMEHILRTFQSSDTDNFSALCSILLVSEVTIEPDDSLSDGFQLQVSRAEGVTCARCYKVTHSSTDLCSRCERVLSHTEGEKL